MIRFWYLALLQLEVIQPRLKGCWRFLWERLPIFFYFCRINSWVPYMFEGPKNSNHCLGWLPLLKMYWYYDFFLCSWKYRNEFTIQEVLKHENTPVTLNLNARRNLLIFKNYQVKIKTSLLCFLWTLLTLDYLISKSLAHITVNI